MISQAEVLYHTDGIKQGIRADGRSADVIRPYSIDMGVVSMANGSCRVRSSGCDLYVAIKSEISRPLFDKPNEGIVEVSVEFACSAMARQSETTLRQATQDSESLAEITASQISQLCLSCLDKEKFCIAPSAVCWKLSIDVLVDRLDGPILDPISTGIRAALMDLQLPVVVVPADDERDGDEPAPVIPKVALIGTMWHPAVTSAICVSVGVFCDNSVIIVDLDRIEETLAKQPKSCLITMAVNDLGECCGIRKYGIGSVDPMILRDVLSAGLNVGQQISTLMTSLATL